MNRYGNILLDKLFLISRTKIGNEIKDNNFQNYSYTEAFYTGVPRELPFEEKLWAAADKLRCNMGASEYKHVVLGLIFLKYIFDAFD